MTSWKHVHEKPRGFQERIKYCFGDKKWSSRRKTKTGPRKWRTDVCFYIVWFSVSQNVWKLKKYFQKKRSVKKEIRMNFLINFASGRNFWGHLHLDLILSHEIAKFLRVIFDLFLFFAIFWNLFWFLIIFCIQDRDSWHF